MMGAKFKLLRLYSFKDFVQMSIALVLDMLYKRIPKRVFLVKNTYDSLIARNARISRNAHELSIDLDGLNFRLRSQGSDLQVFNQIVLGHGVGKIVELISEFKILKPRIMDCGANIGLSTMMFKAAYPQASIIAIEPDSANYDQLKKNFSANAFKEVTAVCGGVWFEKTKLSLTKDFRDGSDWSVALKKGADDSLNTIEVDTPEYFAHQAGWDAIDVLKIDIEGSEFPLFKNLDSWTTIFNTVKIISIEPHEECGDPQFLIDLLIHHGFRIRLYQELIIGTRNL